MNDPTHLPVAARKIFVVEDNELIGADMKCLLDEGGFDVVGWAHSAETALQFVERNAKQIDCVLLDIELSGQSCKPLADSLEELKLPYVLVTGHSEETVRKLGFRAPVIEKPFQNHELLERLSDV